MQSKITEIKITGVVFATFGLPMYGHEHVLQKSNENFAVSKSKNKACFVHIFIAFLGTTAGYKNTRFPNL